MLSSDYIEILLSKTFRYFTKNYIICYSRSGEGEGDPFDAIYLKLDFFSKKVLKIDIYLLFCLENICGGYSRIR